MSQRLETYQHSPALLQKLVAFSDAAHEGAVEESTLLLVNIRAAQLNGCAFCLDMHVKEAKIAGERELRIHHLPVWRESPLFSARERAALAWTEAVTRLSDTGVSDELYQQARAQFSEKELSDLTFAIGVINVWTRLNVAFRRAPGSADAMFGLEKAGLR